MAKCQREGLDVKNHMSTLSAGLTETIREWFSEGEHALTIEKTARVDLEKVKEKKPRKKRASASPKEGADEGDSASTAVATCDRPMDEGSEVDAVSSGGTATMEVSEAVEEAASEGSVEVESEKGKPHRLSPKELAALTSSDAAAEVLEVPAAEAPVETVETIETVETAASAAAEVAASPGAEAAQEAGGAAEAGAGSESEESSTAGPRMVRTIDLNRKKSKRAAPAAANFVPTPAQLQGPKVVRVERADVLPAPPSRPPRRGPAAPAAAGLDGPIIGSPETSGKGRRGKRGRVAEETTEERETRMRLAKKRGVVAGGRRGHEKGGRDWEERLERLSQASASKLHGRERRLAQSERSTAGHAVEHHKIEKAEVKEPITVKELSAAIGVRVNEIIGKLMGMGVMAAMNQSLDADAAMMVSAEFGVELTVEREKALLDRLAEEFDQEVSEDKLTPRPPIVAFLGHVDHGKTSLLDRIRKSSVTAGEAGGITQHIGSYLYDDGERRVTFLDTPGHEAFTAMRARGANMTDIVVLVVAADDGVMPQTEEAINHAKAAGVSIVVALNKIDLPNADENRVFGQLAEHKLVPTMWGGDTEVVRTSAATGEGIADLVEHLDYTAELRQLRASAEGPATGWVIEAEMNPQQGAQVRLLVKQGTVRPGDMVVSGCCYGRIRTLLDAAGTKLKEAGPAMPIVVTGLDEVPVAGDRFFVVEDASRAKTIADDQRTRMRDQRLAKHRQVTLENLFSEIAAGETNELNVIIKADVQGSVDVLSKAVMEMNTQEVAVRVLHTGVGGINESDVLLAEASGAIVIGFQVVADERARGLADQEGVQIRLYRVIYKITDDIKAALEGMLAPRIEEKSFGTSGSS